MMRTERTAPRALRGSPEPARRGAPGAGPHALAARAPSAARERARGRLVATVFVIYVLAIFEGSIRKFVLPQLSQYIFFVRDPFLIYAYLLATRHGLWPRRGLFFALSVAMCGLGVLLFMLQLAINGLDTTRILLGIYGWRGYFFYVPLAFLVGEQFNSVDIARLAKVTLWLAIPIALLVAVQFASLPTDAINRGVSDDEQFQFKGIGLTAERIRPTGPFTSSAGQQQFVGTAFAFALALLVLPRSRRQVGVLTLAAGTCAVLTCVALGGSRGTTIQCALSAAFALSLGLIGRGGTMKTRALVLPGLLAVAAVLLYPVLFPEGFEAFTSRWTTAAAAETGFDGGVIGRALFGLVEFTRLVNEVPTLGYGLGYAGNASTTLQVVVDGVKPGSLAEADFARQMVDLGPALGIAYIAFRVALVAWLARMVWRATRGAAAVMPLLLFSYVGLTVLGGQITGHGTINVYAWLFTGLTIAASSLAASNAPLTAPLARHRRVFALRRRAGTSGPTVSPTSLASPSQQ